jgi:hypothetical protein
MEGAALAALGLRMAMCACHISGSAPLGAGMWRPRLQPSSRLSPSIQ